MFNVNNTYIRISGCIINVPLDQDGIVIGTYNVSFDDMTYNFGTTTTGFHYLKKQKMT